ncbi:Uncharacterised protein [Yersinia pekkanenii]|uniref:Uncharacterized protein n=1 Tax=Yersinia pekkanenii TaxID=1288385 RepID=A0ABM9U0T4_9GAMM|nr:Uncharacterised protein [Yersinia pekkanenii]
MITGQVSSDLHPFTVRAGAIEGSVIQLSIAIDFDTRTGVGGAVHRAVSDGTTQLHAITFRGFAVDGGIAFIG